MSSLDVLLRISQTNLINYDFKYCLVASNKKPYKDVDIMASPNNVNDFKLFEELNLEIADSFEGIGISIQGSNICAIDVDHCFSEKNDINSADERAISIMKLFKNHYYEFSFSGTGLRVLFKYDIIDNYKTIYYIKNSNNNIEFYQPTKDSYRYVTVTGNAINDKPITEVDEELLYNFLDMYMKREIKEKRKVKINHEETDLKVLQKLVRKLYLKDFMFQDKWFGKAPGSGSNESELDFALISYLYENITTDKESIRLLFETSPYFKSKDRKHLNKWYYDDYRYFNYIYDHL